MKKDKAKIVGAMVGGALIGGAAGILFAPKKGSETREDIKNTINNILEKTKAIDKDSIKKYVEKRLEELNKDLVKLDELDSYKKAKKQAKKIIKKIDKLIKYTTKKGISDFDDLVEELKEKAEEISEEILTDL